MLITLMLGRCLCDKVIIKTSVRVMPVWNVDLGLFSVDGHGTWLRGTGILLTPETIIL